MAGADQPDPFGQFNERCLVRGPDFQRTVTAAKDRDWPALATDMATSLAPVEDPVALEGWNLTAEGDGSFEALVVARASVGDSQVESCTMAFAEIDAAAFERRLVDETHAQASGAKNGQGRVRKFLEASSSERRKAITVDLPLYPNGHDEVIVSVVSEQQIEN
ncbi:hypothetical protein [Rhizobium sp. BK529]|uniref:hypothetical protein n=1 Tax=Rhizobium sp. BK529 TaxID=2586983 RepID=UPI0028AD8E06|nr:hypothetical protein [Rhizobium sp. BK529]